MAQASARAHDPVDGSHQATGDSARLKFLGIDANTSERLRGLKPLIAGELPRVAAEFYAHVGAWPALAAMLGDSANIERLKRTQAAHWDSLFSGRFDDDYFKRATTVGQVHARIGLEPRWYIGGYCLVLQNLVRALVAKHGARPALADDINALLRASMLDLDVSISTYIERGEADRIKAEMLSVAEVLDREVRLAVSGISTQAASLSEGADVLTRVAEQLREPADAVSSAVEANAETVQTVAGATEQMDASSRAISSQITQASSATQQAVQQTSATVDTVRELADATGKINDIVKLIRSIAGQTKLLALNATIEAARAGEMGKGFAVVASEVKSLARQTEDAIQNVSAQADAIGHATGDATTMVGGIGQHIGSVDTIAREISTAADQQRQATGEITASIARVAENSRGVAERARELLNEAESTKDTAARFKGLATDVSNGVRDLQSRLTVILRASHAGNRRREEREPATVAFTCRGALSARGHTIDLSPGGALLAAQSNEDIVGQTIDIELAEVGQFTAKVAAVSGLGVHVQFIGAGEAARERLRATIESKRKADAVYIAKATETASKIAGIFERAIAERKLTMDQLFDSAYRRIAGTNPPQFMNAVVPLADAEIRPAIDPVKDGDRRVVFCLATDGNGFLPTHNREYCQPQRPDDAAWNTAHCRNRRIFDDRTGILAARSTAAHLIQAYLRDMGGGQKQMLKEFDAPIVVQGRQWGAVRLAITP